MKHLRQIREYEQRLKGLEQEVRPGARLRVVAAAGQCTLQLAP